MDKRVAIVTGGTSGIGLAAAKALVAKGVKVYTVSRREASLPGATHLVGDVTNEDRVREIFRTVYEAEKRIDILVNCAGFGISGAAEFTENADAKRLLDVNLFGVVNTCKCAIPYMREAGRGRIVNIGSVAGIFAIPYQSWYSVSKFAVNAYTLALSNEVKQFGISVCCVMPGDIATGFTAAREKSPTGDAVYNGRISRSVAKMEKDEQNGMDANIAGRFICRIATKKRVKPSCAIGVVYQFLAFLSKVLPIKLIDVIVGMLYGGK